MKARKIAEWERYSIDLEEGGLVVPSTRGPLRSRTGIVANLEKCGLLHVTFGFDLLPPEPHDVFPCVALPVDLDELEHCSLHRMRSVVLLDFFLKLPRDHERDAEFA